MMDVELNKEYDTLTAMLSSIVTPAVQRRMVDVITDTLWYYASATNNWSIAEQLTRARAEFVQKDATAQRTGNDVAHAEAVTALEHCEELEHDLAVVAGLFDSYKALYEKMPAPNTGLPETWRPRRERRGQRPVPGQASVDRQYEARVAEYRNTKTAAGKAAVKAKSNGQPSA